MNLRKVSANALSILSSVVMNRATSFVLYALVARHLGAHEFGQLTLSFTLFYAFQVFAVGGLKTLLIRQVAKDRTQTARYFLNGCAIVMLTSIASIAAVWAFVYLMHYPRSTTMVILLLSFGLLPSTFLGIDGTTAIMASLNVIMLSKLAGETEVGLYSSAAQLLVPLLLVYTSMAQSIFPMMCRKIDPGYRSLKQIAEQAMELLMVLALPSVAGLYFLGDRVLALLYKNPAFVQAFPALRIMTFVLIFQVFTSVLGQVLVASHREKITLRIVVVDTVVNLLVGFPLISLFGLRGAAIAWFLTRLVDCIQHYIPAAHLLSGIPVLRLVWKPVVAAGCMALYLALPAGQVSLLTGVSATVIYGAALLGLAVWASGGLHQFKEKYRPLLSE